MGKRWGWAFAVNGDMGSEGIGKQELLAKVLSVGSGMEEQMTYDHVLC